MCPTSLEPQYPTPAPEPRVFPTGGAFASFPAWWTRARDSYHAGFFEGLRSRTPLEHSSIRFSTWRSSVCRVCRGGVCLVNARISLVVVGLQVNKSTPCPLKKLRGQGIQGHPVLVADTIHRLKSPSPQLAFVGRSNVGNQSPKARPSQPHLRTCVKLGLSGIMIDRRIRSTPSPSWRPVGSATPRWEEMQLQGEQGAQDGDVLSATSMLGRGLTQTKVRDFACALTPGP